MKKLFLALALLLLMAPQAQSQKAPKEYQLVWSDEFDKPQLDESKWNIVEARSGWVNAELQRYTKDPENFFIKDGKLHIKAIAKDKDVTSARLTTSKKGDWLYGRFEIRAKVPAGLGIWPAIWMMPTVSKYGGWPSSGEIDIMEFVGYMPNVIHGTVHTKKYNHTIGTQKGKTLDVKNVAGKFHDYVLEWDADQIKIYVDKTCFFTFNREADGGSQAWPFDNPFHIILNVAFGGSWGGAKGVDYNILPQEMEVDYVRVYQKK